MTVRVGINGFGRIGRQSLKAIIERAPDVEVVAVNDLVDTATNALLFKHDSTYGAYPGTVDHTDDALIIDGREIKVLQVKRPGAAAVGATWASTSCSSRPACSPTRRRRRAHLDAGARKVIISAPAKGEDVTIVLGVNEGVYDPEKHHIISNASCTTNCLAPAAKVVHDGWTSSRGLMNTIHSYTNDQRILDVGPQGSAPRARRRPEHHPDDDRRRQGAGARHSRSQGQVRRLQPPRADAHRVASSTSRPSWSARPRSRSSTTRSARPPPAP